jgi:hypothetical protein
MFIDPQSDVYAQYLQRKGDLEFPYRVNWEFQEQMRQHLLKTHAPDIINTTAFMNAPPSQFPQWTTPDLAQRQAMPNGGGMTEEAPQYRDMQYYEEEMPEQEEGEEVEYLDENGQPVTDMTEEEKQQADAEKAQSTQQPQNVQKEAETQHNDTPPPAPVAEAPKAEPPSKPSNPTAQEVETQYNVPATSTPTPTPVAPAAPQKELSYYEQAKKYAADKLEAAKNYMKR